MNERDSALAAAPPWYRQRWPWLLMLGPAIVVVAGIATIWIAVATDDGVVADDYYKRGLAINQTLERAERARALGVRAVVDLAADGRVDVALASGSAEAAAAPASLRVRFVHPTRAGEDRVAMLPATGGGRYAGRVEPLAEGRWRVMVETDDWRLPAVTATTPIRGLELAPAAAR